MLDVLLLLAVTRRLLERTNDQRRGGGDDRDGCLTVLDGELAGDAQTLLFGGKNMFVSFNVSLSLRTFRDRGNSRFDVVCASQRSNSYPVASGLGNIFSDLLGGQTQRTDLGSQSGGGTDLTTSGTEVAISNKSASIIRSNSLVSSTFSLWRRDQTRRRRR